MEIQGQCFLAGFRFVCLPQREAATAHALKSKQIGARTPVDVRNIALDTKHMYMSSQVRAQLDASQGQQLHISLSISHVLALISFTAAGVAHLFGHRRL